MKANWRKWQPIEDENLEAFAAAYRQTEEWFGAPPDPEWPYQAWEGHHGACRRNPIFRTYIISIEPGRVDYSARCSTIAHEMYHRFTMRKAGLHKQVWIDEMLAYQTESMTLLELGQSEYANRLAAWARKEPKPMDGAALRQVRRKREFLGVGGPAYPEGFGSAIYRFSDALEALVNWEAMRQIVGASTWKAWFTTLPPSLIPLVKYILEFPDNEGPIISESDPNRVPLMRRLALALFRKGGIQDSIALYEQAISLKPKAYQAYHGLGFCYAEQGNAERAIENWLKSLCLKPAQAAIHFNLSVQYNTIDNTGEAIRHLEEAVRLKPEEVRYTKFLKKLSGAQEA